MLHILIDIGFIGGFARLAVWQVHQLRIEISLCHIQQVALTVFDGAKFEICIRQHACGIGSALQWVGYQT